MLMETEISVNGKILIPLMGTKKLRKTETKRKTLTRKLTNLARPMSIFVSVVFPFHAIMQVLCNVIRYVALAVTVKQKFAMHE